MGNKMDTINKIRVMQHYADGGEVEFRPKNSIVTSWDLVLSPSWDWSCLDYRIKKEKRIVIEKWLCQDKKGDYLIRETSNIDRYLTIKQIKLLEIYEVEV